MLQLRCSFFPLLCASTLLIQDNLAFVVSVADDQEIEVISNPHAKNFEASQAEGDNPLLDHLLEPYQLIVTPLAIQADTFQELKYDKVLTVPVPIYKMKQPARISTNELEFQMVLVKDLGKKAACKIQAVPHPMTQTIDSWFPEYYWAPLVMSCDENTSTKDATTTANTEEDWKHVGWKFTQVPPTSNETLADGNSSNSNDLLHSYALLVQIDETKKKEGVRLGGVKAPGWTARTITS